MTDPQNFTFTFSAPLFTAACLLCCGIWFSVGCYKLSHYAATVDKIREHRVPLAPLAYWLSVAAEFGGTLLVGSQQYVTAGALIWLLFLVLATPVYHGRVIRNGIIDFPEFVQVFKNVSIAGGLLALIALDAARRHG